MESIDAKFNYIIGLLEEIKIQQEGIKIQQDELKKEQEQLKKIINNNSTEYLNQTALFFKNEYDIIKKPINFILDKTRFFMKTDKTKEITNEMN